VFTIAHEVVIAPTIVAAKKNAPAATDKNIKRTTSSEIPFRFLNLAMITLHFLYIF
jgi:hypothetical protein